eukprot:3797673-Prymnesium_polylepis.1
MSGPGRAYAARGAGARRTRRAAPWGATSRPDPTPRAFDGGASQWALSLCVLWDLTRAAASCWRRSQRLATGGDGSGRSQR